MNEEYEQALYLAKTKRLADGVRKDDEKWNGYTVYIPTYAPDPFGSKPCIGLPVCILARNGQCRLSTHEEAFAYIRELKKRWNENNKK